MKETAFSAYHGAETFGLLLVSLLVFLSGCGFKDIHEQTSLMDNTGILKGTIRNESPQDGPIHVLRFRNEEGLFVLERKVTAAKDGSYEFNVTRGKYSIFAFIDISGDGKYQPEEYGNYIGTPASIEVQDNEVLYVQPIVITGLVPKPEKEITLIDKSLAVWENIGQIVTLDDPRFTSEMYSAGLWRPLDFLEKAEGGLFFLEEYDKNKTPVLFIHGVLNGPTLWQKVLADLDRKHFQPWLFYYPSGLRLDMISDYLTQAVSQLQEEYDFPKYYVVAHSMGGLVARSFVKKYVEKSTRNSSILQLLVTVNSPMDGMSAAAQGLQHSPIIVPSWRDVATDSEFLRELYAWKWPKEIQYHLVVSYIDNKSHDGVVPLQSQATL
ncbi:MAG: alpha/beta fold hydrolase, partial [Desulfopila sp.]|nr:alpha/beta fold hydrolase [Desulfopila sp.]